MRGVRKMNEEDRYCVDVLDQTTAIRSAFAQVALLVLEHHADHCVEAAIASQDPKAQREKFRELLRGFEKVCR